MRNRVKGITSIVTQQFRFHDLRMVRNEESAMITTSRLSIIAVATATLIAASSVQASPIFFTNLSDFEDELGSVSLSVERFENFKSNRPSGTNFGAFTIESGDDIDKGPHGTNGPTSLKISENTDDFVKFTFHAPITAFRIDLVDALDDSGGSIVVTVDGVEHVIGPFAVELPDLNQLFIGVIDLDGFTMVKIDSDDTKDLLFYDNLRHTRIAEPATIALFGLGLAGLGYMRRRRST